MPRTPRLGDDSTEAMLLHLLDELVITVIRVGVFLLLRGRFRR